MDFTIRREIIFKSETATDRQVNKKEVELILKYGSNNRNVGYNRSPKLKTEPNK